MMCINETSAGAGVGLLVGLGVSLLTALVGYWLGSVKYFKEQQFKIYGTVMSPLLRWAFCKPADTAEMNPNVALHNLWIYSSRDVAKKTDKALSYSIDPSRGDWKLAWKEAIIAMRKDVQPLWRCKKRKLLPDDVKHYFLEENT